MIIEIKFIIDIHTKHVYRIFYGWKGETVISYLTMSISEMVPYLIFILMLKSHLIVNMVLVSQDEQFLAASAQLIEEFRSIWIQSH